MAHSKTSIKSLVLLLFLAETPLRRYIPVLQCKPEGCGIGLVLPNKHAHSLSIALALFQCYCQQVILGFQVLNTAVEKEVICNLQA